MRWSEKGFHHLLLLRLAWVNRCFDALFPSVPTLKHSYPPNGFKRPDAGLGAKSHQLRALDGLITNDKFCWIRHGRLKLNWSQAQLRQAAEFSRASDSLQALDGAVPLETANEAAVDNQATSQGNPRRTNPLGPSLSNSPESGSPQPTGDRRNCASPPSDDGPPGDPRENSPLRPCLNAPASSKADD